MSLTGIATLSSNNASSTASKKTSSARGLWGGSPITDESHTPGSGLLVGSSIMGESHTQVYDLAVGSSITGNSGTSACGLAAGSPLTNESRTSARGHAAGSLITGKSSTSARGLAAGSPLMSEKTPTDHVAKDLHCSDDKGGNLYHNLPIVLSALFKSPTPLSTLSP